MKNLLGLFSFRPLQTLRITGGSVMIDSSEKTSLSPSDQLNSLYGVEDIYLKNISLNIKGINSGVFIEKVYANLSSSSDSIFYVSIKDNARLGSLTISLQPQFNQSVTDSFLGEVNLTQINFNDPLIKALCNACSSLGKAEGLLKISYLNKWKKSN